MGTGRANAFPASISLSAFFAVFHHLVLPTLKIHRESHRLNLLHIRIK